MRPTSLNPEHRTRESAASLLVVGALACTMVAVGATAQPANDDCGNAISALPPGQFFVQVPFDTTGATTDGVTTHAVGPMENDIWFTVDGDHAEIEFWANPGARIAVYRPVVACTPREDDLLGAGTSPIQIDCGHLGTLLVRLSTEGLPFNSGTLRIQGMETCTRWLPAGSLMTQTECGQMNQNCALIWCERYCGGCQFVPRTCDDDDPCTYDTCVNQWPPCVNTQWTYGDVDHAGGVTTQDVQLVHSAFQGDFSSVRLQDVDLDPCDAPNGMINLLDALAVLRAMGGDHGCCPSGAASIVQTSDTVNDDSASPQNEEMRKRSADADSRGLLEAATPRLFWVPEGGSPLQFPAGPTLVPADAGERVCAELWIQGSGAFSTNGVQVRIEAATAVDAAGGEWVRADCPSITIDEGHPDLLGSQLRSVADYQCDPSPAGTIAWLHSTSSAGAVVPAAPKGKYLGEICFEVANNAFGDFTIDFDGTPGIDTIVTAQDGSVLNALLDPLTIMVRVPHDVCVDARTITIGTTAFDTDSAWTDGDTTHPCGPLEADAWFSYTSDCCGLLDVTATGGVDVAVYAPGAACTPGAAELLDCQAGAAGVIGAPGSPGERTLIRIGTDDGSFATGEITLSLSQCTTCDDGDWCTDNGCVDGQCAYTDWLYGDVDRNGVITLADLFCVLDGYSGDFSMCSFANDDVHPCGGNGVIGLLDLFAVLDAFVGEYACCQ